MSGRIAVVGDATTVAGFRALGLAAHVAEPPSRARELWPDVSQGQFDIVLITEEVYAGIADLVAATAERTLPAVTIIPGAGSAGGVAEERLSRAIERALGTSVPSREED